MPMETYPESPEERAARIEREAQKVVLNLTEGQMNVLRRAQQASGFSRKERKSPNKYYRGFLRIVVCSWRGHKPVPVWAGGEWPIGCSRCRRQL